MEIAAAKPGAVWPARDEAAMRTAAAEFEASFLAEMLTAAGVGKQPSAFGGGSGEDQFASFLVREQAREMVEAGGLGLAESIFQAMSHAGPDHG